MARRKQSAAEKQARAQQVRQVLTEEMAAMQAAGIVPSLKQAKDRVARRLDMSPRTVERLLATLDDPAEAASLGGPAGIAFLLSNLKIDCGEY